VLPDSPLIVLRAPAVLPTGPVIVCMFGLVLLGAYLLRRIVGRVPETGRQPVPERGDTVGMTTR
jgi:hypothetical protein